MSYIISFFQKLIKGGVGIRAGGLENFSKINKQGDDYSVLESTANFTEGLNFEAFLASGVGTGNLGPSTITCSTDLLTIFCHDFHIMKLNRGEKLRRDFHRECP